MNASSAQPNYAPFVHLRVHSAYSMAEGAIKIGKLVDLCVAENMPAVALTDTRNLFGALEFSQTAAKAGVQPIIGCQLSIRRDDVPTGHGNSGRAPEPDALVVLVQNAKGYANLIKLVSRAFLETSSGEIPQVAWSDIAGHTDGLIALTAGPVGTVSVAEGAGRGALGLMPLPTMRAMSWPSITTAASSCRVMPSNTTSAATA